MHYLADLIEIAVSLTQAVSASDRYDRFLNAIRNLIPCDAASLMVLEQPGALRPLAAFGLSAKAMRKAYPLSEHPRLELICNSTDPVIFPSESSLPDPFDHLLGEEEGSPGHVHSCMGCPLTVQEDLVGIFTLDALKPDAFDDLDYKFLKLLGALAGAALQTSLLIARLETQHRDQLSLTEELLKTDDQRAGQLLGVSKVIDELKGEIRTVAGSDFSVLITGESGVGKELVARSIHRESRRAGKPLIYVNCAALPESLAESELFGHAKGAFTGAVQARAGKFEVAHGGTLFLDEIGELAPPVQAKLLRALQEGEVQRVGTDDVKKVDVRIIAATNRDLEQESADGRFRLDLYHRLHVYPIHVAPLRDHLEDLETLVMHFAEKSRRPLGLRSISIIPETYLVLKGYSWPGNIRELKNAVTRAMLKAHSDQKEPALHLRPIYFDGYMERTPDTAMAPKPKPASPSLPDLPLRQRVEMFQKQEILAMVERTNGNWSKAAELLGINRSNLHHLAKRLGLK